MAMADTTEHHVEVLAMNIWMGMFGVKVIQPAWIDWSVLNPDPGEALRAQAREMLGVANSHASRPTSPKTTNHHSLAWLFT